MLTQNSKQSKGRKPNVWTVLKFEDISNYMTETSIPASRFVKTIGVSNQTFHNWKNHRCAPTEEMQRRIKNAIDVNPTGEETTMTTTETTAPKAPKKAIKRVLKKRGKGSAALAALTDATPTTAEAAAVPAPTKKAGRRPGPRKATATTTATTAEAKAPKTPKARKAAKAATNGTNGTNGTSSSSPTDWAELSTLGAFLKANQGKSREELAGIIDVARELLV